MSITPHSLEKKIYKYDVHFNLTCNNYNIRKSKSHKKEEDHEKYPKRNINYNSVLHVYI